MYLTVWIYTDKASASAEDEQSVNGANINILGRFFPIKRPKKKKLIIINRI